MTSERKIQLFLFGILLAVYLLVYIPIPDSIDGSDTLDVARTLVLAGSPASTILSTPRQLIVTGSEGEQYLISPDGERYTKKGVTPSLLLIPFVLAAKIFPWLSIRATAMLFNPLVLALSGVAVYTLLREFGSARSVAVVSALIYGLVTMALVYSRTLFGEPLAALLLTIALIYTYRFRKTETSRAAFIAGLALALCIGVNLTYAALIPFFAIYAFAQNRFWRNMAAFALPVAAAVVFLAFYNLIRYGSLTESGYYLGSVEGFTTPLLHGLYGLWLSPHKGFFWYNPVMLLALPGIVLLFRRDRALTLILLALVVAQSVIYGTWWAWDGAWCWGPRFLLPVLPLMMLFVAPVIEKAFQRRSLLIPVIFLGVISAGVQLLGALFDYRIFFERIYVFDLTAPTNNPILAHLAMLLTGWQSDLAWQAEGFDAVHLLAAVILAIVSAAVLILPRRIEQTPPRRQGGEIPPPSTGEDGGGFAPFLTKRAGRISLLTAVIIALNIVASRQQDNVSQQYVSHLTETLQPPGTVLVASFQPGTALMDVETIPRFIVLNPHTLEDNPLVQKQIQKAKERSDILWYMTWLPPASPDNWLERSLWQNYALITQTIPDETHRLMGFHLRPVPDAITPGGWNFQELRLEHYGIRRDDDGIFLSLAWSIPEATATDYTWFVHLLNAEGTIIRQQDRAPQGGYSTGSEWKSGKIITDRLFFPLDAGTDITGWHLRIGVISPGDGQPVRVTDAQGNPLNDSFVLLPLEQTR